PEHQRARHDPCAGRRACRSSGARLERSAATPARVPGEPALPLAATRDRPGGGCRRRQRRPAGARYAALLRPLRGARRRHRRRRVASRGGGRRRLRVRCERPAAGPLAPPRGPAPGRPPAPGVARGGAPGPPRPAPPGPAGTSAGSLATVLAQARAALDGPDTTPAPGGSYHALGSHPSTWRRAVEATLDDIAAGRLEKLVLARTCTVRGIVPFDPWRVVARLSRAYPGCTTFAVPSGAATLVG